MSNNYNHNPNKDDLVVAGIKVNDYGPDVRYKIDYDEDFNEVITGTDGDTMKVEHNNRNATITINILAASPLNLIFTQLADKNADFAVMTTEGNIEGDVGFFTPKAHFTKIPTKSSEKSPKPREWQIKAINLRPSTAAVTDLI